MALISYFRHRFIKLNMILISHSTGKCAIFFNKLLNLRHRKSISGHFDNSRTYQLTSQNKKTLFDFQNHISPSYYEVKENVLEKEFSLGEF